MCIKNHESIPNHAFAPFYFGFEPGIELNLIKNPIPHLKVPFFDHGILNLEYGMDYY
jgi:hypothetical protein